VLGERSTNPNEPQVRWLMHEGELVIGEVRTDQSRYMLTDQVGSILSVTEARSNEQGESIDAEVLMTNDFDTFGRMKTGEVSFESGSAAERALSAYTYTGMRQAAVGGTTHHGARDYAASLSSWLQTDQYLNAFDDLSLSIDPITRDRHAYAGGNPIGYVDRDGHRFTDGSGREWMPMGGGRVWHSEGHTGSSSAASCFCTYVQNTSNNTYSSSLASGARQYSAPAFKAQLTEKRAGHRLSAATQSVAIEVANFATSPSLSPSSSGNKWVGRTCSITSNVVLGSNACNGTSAGELAWNAVNLASWLLPPARVGLAGVAAARVGAKGVAVTGARAAKATTAAKACHNCGKVGGRFDIVPRKSLGRDGSASRHLNEIDAYGSTISSTHQVFNPFGTLIHQHQTHIGKYGTRECLRLIGVRWTLGFPS
jgi:RHS repeat-associated protein